MCHSCDEWLSGFVTGFDEVSCQTVVTGFDEFLLLLLTDFFLQKMDVYDKIFAGYGLYIYDAKAWGDGKLVKLLQIMTDSVSCEVPMFFLPLVTSVYIDW